MSAPSCEPSGWKSAKKAIGDQDPFNMEATEVSATKWLVEIPPNEHCDVGATVGKAGAQQGGTLVCGDALREDLLDGTIRLTFVL